MFRSARPYARGGGLDEPARLLPGRGRRRPATGELLRHVPIPLALAREAIAAIEDEGFALNCYVDDELYVAELTPEARATPSSRASDDPRRRRPARLARAAADEARRRRRPGALDALEAALRAALRAAASTSPSRSRTSSSSRARRSRKGRASPSSPSGSASRRGRRSGSATARTTSSCSSGPATASRSRTRTRHAAGDRRLRLPRPSTRRASRRSSRRFLDSRHDRPQGSPRRPGRLPRGARAQGRGEAFDALLAADERWRALVPQVDELRARRS